MAQFNLGNVVGLIRSLTPPASKPFVMWGKILNIAFPLVVELRIYAGTGDPALEGNWLPILPTIQKVQFTITSGTAIQIVPSATWAILGNIPITQVIDTATGTLVNITPIFTLGPGPGYVATQLLLNFGGPIPNDFLLNMS